MGCVRASSLAGYTPSHAASLSHSPSRSSIKQLTKLIGAYAPDAIKTQEMAAYNGRKLAIDASMAIYQFLVRARVSAKLLSPLPQRATPLTPPPFCRSRCAQGTVLAARLSS